MNELYIKNEKIGKGSYGDVYSAKHKSTGNMVAMKRIRVNTKQDIPITTKREIKILKLTTNKSIIKLLNVISSDEDGYYNVYLIFPRMKTTMKLLMNQKYGQLFTAIEIQNYMRQLLSAVEYLHENNIMHRDISPANILVDESNSIIKLSDFGLSCLKNKKKYSTTVVTLWYRCPEVLLGDTQYGFGIDIWACGCIFGQWLLNAPLFAGRDEHSQIQLIWNICGTPIDSINCWTNAIRLPLYKRYKSKYDIERILLKFFKCQFKRSHWITDVALNLLDKMLTLDPTKRINAIDCNKHEYFN